MTQDTIDLFGHWGLGHKAETHFYAVYKHLKPAVFELKTQLYPQIILREQFVHSGNTQSLWLCHRQTYMTGRRICQSTHPPARKRVILCF